jgi:lambda family phage portal protein
MSLFDIFRRRSAPTPDRAEIARRRRAAIGRATRSLFQAADTTRLESSWTTTPHTVDTYVEQHWTTLVARSRDASHNNDHAKKFLQLVQDNVVGSRGFRFHADVKDPVPVNGRVSIDLPASNAIEAEFRRFSRKGSFDVSGKLSRRDFERLWAKTLATDGEAIAIKVYGAKAGPYGFALQMVDPVFLDPRHNQIAGTAGNVVLPAANFIRHGIEFTPEGKPVRYYFREYEETHVGYITYSSQNFRVVDAADVIHDFLPEVVNQKRGLPWMRASLWRLRMLKGYEDAAVTSARVGAAKMGFFKDPEGELVNEDELPADADPGTFQNIGGLDFVPFDPAYPTGDFGPFMKRALMSIASGLGPAYHNLASDMEGVNYTSSRTAELAERELWKGLQEHIIDSLCVPIYEAWIDFCLLADKIKIAGKPLKMERAERYKDAGIFTGRRWAWVDPSKEVSAHEKAVALGIKSRQSIIRETGDEPWDTWDEIQEERDEMSKRGIPVDAEAGAQTVSLMGAEGEPVDVASGGSGPKQAANVAATQGDIQATALNGAQVTALVALAAQVANGQLPLETAKAIAKAAFPLVPDAEVDAIFAPLTKFTPKPEPAPQPAKPADAGRDVQPVNIHITQPGAPTVNRQATVVRNPDGSISGIEITDKPST